MQAARTAGPTPGMPAAVADALRRGALVLTANQRAARNLRFAFNAAQKSAGHTHWDAADIRPLETWLESLWNQLLLDGADSRLLLNSTQQHMLWRETIAADAELSILRSTMSSEDALAAFAELASRAWRLLHLHAGSLDDADFQTSTDTRAFSRWARQFARTCSRELFLTSAELPSTLQTAFTRHRLSLTHSELLLVDFDHHPPAHRFFLEALRKAGILVEETETSVARTSGSLHAAAEPQEEFHAAAHWARQHLDANPTAQIALVGPDLANVKPLLERVFSEHLNSTSEAAPPLFEFSLGQPLAETGPGAAALDLLAWSLGPLSLDRISHLLLSPFLTRPEELDSVARFDAFDLRTAPLLRPELSLDQTLSLLSRSGVAPELLRRLRAAKQESLPLSLEQSYAAHAEHFAVLLDAAGWTRAVPADSVVAQIRRRWESALDELATLDFRQNTTQPTAAAALEALTRIARQSIFAQQSRNAAVQILGPLELGGLPFDALWFLSADDRTWPARPTPHPLLPQRLQRRLGIPGANATDDDRNATALTRRIAHSAPEVVFSYAQRAEDSDRQPSPVLRELGLTPAAIASPLPEASPAPYLRIPEAADLPALPDATLRGGERVLKDQAACAFRAFAEHRLWSTKLPTRNPGLDPRDRGSLVHRILETFWAELQDQATLRALPLSDRHALLDQAIDLALEQPARHVRSPWDSAYLDIERERLRMLLRPWLEIELERPAFRVQQQEQRLSEVALGGVRLNLRVDRVDDTAAGPLILDYKTGASRPSEWLTDRPDAPQLPLYAVFNPAETLGGVAFALLRAGNDLGMNGFSDHFSAVLPGKPAPMPRTLAEQREEWLRVLTRLASAFASGDTRVEPKAYPGTCQYCAQRLLCRLEPSTLTATEDDNIREEEAATHG